MATIVIAFAMPPAERAVVSEVLGDAATPVYLTDLNDGDRADALSNATAVLSWNTAKELRESEAALLRGARLLQFMTAGVDFIPLKNLPSAVMVAANGGAYAEQMAEHALAMTLAAAKRLLIEHAALVRGEFNQHKPNRLLAGGICGILGFGGIGVATARLMRGMGMRIHAINRRGASEEPTDWIGTTAALDEFLGVADVLVIATPLTPQTLGMIGAPELGLMKPDAILVNLARGEIIDEAALFAHLQTHPDFTACIDAWWVEPARHGKFRMDQPFLTLPNVVGSPHNSASVRGTRGVGLRRAVTNIRRMLDGETPRYLVGPDERMM
ncbi:MAG: 2-hydroxyacid dehydrogenase [Acetobacteraceae bacterium]